MCGAMWDISPTLVQAVFAFAKDLDVKLDEKEIVVSKGKLIEKLYSSWVLGPIQVSIHFFTSFRQRLRATKLVTLN